MEKEINVNVEIEEEDRNLIDLHSFLNILNILTAEIYSLQLIKDELSALNSTIQLIQSIAISLKNKEKSTYIVLNIDTYINQIYSDAQGYVINNNLSEDETAINIISNIKSIIEVLKVRVKEIIARMTDVNEWVEHSKDEIEYNFLNLFAAIEKNSNGKYKIIYNIAEHEEGAYMVNLNINSKFENKIYMPIVFQDVMRDLIANARKYTQIGGMIIAGLSQTEDYLKFAVEDNGMGIPEDEIEKVVGFKYRATNARNTKTYGGGFGLTKAYIITKQLGGRMWIKSILGKGTRIKIEIPKKIGTQ